MYARSRTGELADLGTRCRARSHDSVMTTQYGFSGKCFMKSVPLPVCKVGCRDEAAVVIVDAIFSNFALC